MKHFLLRALVLCGVLAAMVVIGRGVDPALADPPTGQELLVHHVEPLCVVPAPALACSGDSQTAASPGSTSILDFDYGSPLGQVAVYTGPGWQLAKPSAEQDVVVGDFWSQVDRFCDGRPDVIAAPESAPPSVIKSYPLASNAAPLEDWLDEQIPNPAVYPVHSRTSADITGWFLNAARLFRTFNPEPMNVVTQEVPWSPGGSPTLVSVPVLGGQHTPPNFPPVCLQSRQVTTNAFPGQVASLSVTAQGLAEPANSMTVVVDQAQVPGDLRMFAGSTNCPVRQGARVDSGDPERWSVTWSTACVQDGEKVRITFWGEPLPATVDDVEFGGTRSTLAHELGHAYCLTHPIVSNPQNLMNESSTTGEQLQPAQINEARVCASILIGADCSSGCSFPLTFVRVGALGAADWGAPRITAYLAEANEIWAQAGITLTWNGTIIDVADPTAGPGGDGDITCPSSSKTEVGSLSAAAGKPGAFRIFLINEFVDANQPAGCGILGYTAWPGNVPGGKADYVVLATNASETADVDAPNSLVQDALASVTLQSNPSDPGLYQKWTVTGATTFWSDSTADRRSAGLDIAVDLRCYYVTPTGSPKAPPAGLDDDGDCLANVAQGPLPADPDNGNPDTDGDALVDGVEAAWGSNPNDPDTDNDGLDDFTEIYLMTSPLLKDTDGDGDFDIVDNCPLRANANQLDTDLDAWALRQIRAYSSIIAPADSNNATDPKSTAKNVVIDGAKKDALPFLPGIQTIPIQTANAPESGGDACDNDDDNDGLPDAVECTNGAGDCVKGGAPNGVSIVLLPQIEELYTGAAVLPLGVMCVNADVDHDGAQEASAAALAGKLGIPAGQVIEHVAEVRQGNPDSDGDSWLDGYECDAGSNPDDATSVPEVANGIDDDKDGVIDEQALAPTGGGGDADGDGLFNVLEFDARTACVRVGVGGQLPHSVSSHCTLTPRADVDGDTLPDVENDADGDGVSGLLDSDSDGDTIGDAVEVGRERTMAQQMDTDGDGCTDDLELAFPAPLSPPNDPIEALRHHDVNGDYVVSVGDIVLVVLRFGTSVMGSDYEGVRFDTAGPNGAISAEDIFLTVGQFGTNCS